MFYILNLSSPMFLLLSSIMIIISSSSWFSAWMGLELNMMAFIPMIITMNKLSSESALKYYFTQIMGSTLIFFFMMYIYFYSSSLYLNSFMSFFILIYFALMLKLGAAPFHFWFPAMVEGLHWNTTLILMTIQKIGPLNLIMIISTKEIIMPLLFASSSALVGAISGMNQLMCRKLMSYSSIAHLGWLLCANIITKMLLIFYFILYTIMTFNLVLLFKFYCAFHMNQLFYYQNMLTSTLLFLCLNLLSLGGLPPFLGFLPKWLIVKSAMNSMTFMVILLLIFSSIITLYFYLRMTYTATMIIFFKPSLFSFSLKPNMMIKMNILIPVILLPFMTLFM